jgi:hypothetical protein
MNGAIDFAGINAAALRNGRAFLEYLLPGGKFRSLEYVVKNPPGGQVDCADAIQRIRDEGLTELLPQYVRHWRRQ